MQQGLIHSKMGLAEADGAAANVYYTRDSPEIIVPVDGNSITVTGGAGNWGWGAWTEITSGLGSDFVLTKVLMSLVPEALLDAGAVEIGIGAEGSEVAIAEIRYWMGTTTVCTGDLYLSGYSHFPRRVGFYRIDANTRISVRQCSQSNTVRDVYVYLQGYSGTGPTIQQLAVTQQSYVRGDATGASLTIPETGGIGALPLSAWAWTTWSEVLASAGYDMLAYGFGVGEVGAMFALGQGGLIQLGVGAATSEVAIGAAGWCKGSSPQMFGHPILVESGERVAIRIKAAGWNVTPNPCLLADRLA